MGVKMLWLFEFFTYDWNPRKTRGVREHTEKGFARTIWKQHFAYDQIYYLFTVL